MNISAKPCFGKALLFLLLLTVASSLSGATMHYVNINSTNPVPPFTSWSTAATNIQDAVDAAEVGDEIVVTNGVYVTGGRATGSNLLPNRVAVDKAVMLRSVNGPEVTTIRGYQVPGTTNGDGAIRCVYLTNGAVLTGFTLTGGGTRTSGQYQWDQSGGGVRGESPGAVVSNCVLYGNSAYSSGGGAYYGTYFNCAVVDNVASRGGGLYRCTVWNSTLTGNSALAGGGASQGSLNNCILYFNTATSLSETANYLGTALTNCCTTPLPISGWANIAQDPQLASGWRLSALSPCIGAGSAAYAIGTDIDGDFWNNPPSIGCDEYRPESAIGPLSVQVTASWSEVVVGYTVEFRSLILGRATASAWDFGDGTVISNHPCASHVWNTPGSYAVVLRVWNNDNPGGIYATTTVQVVDTTHYVALESQSPVPPYTSWGTAATNIQDAVDAASTAGALVLVSNGVYASGGRAVGTLTNRLIVDKPVIVRSVNGPQSTRIEGYQVPVTVTGTGAVRCVYLGPGAVLSGFTLSKGATGRSGSSVDVAGGGVYCASTSAVLSNCLVIGNSSSGGGGGVYSGIVVNSRLTSNTTTYRGGGVSHANLYNCSLISNSANSSCGGAYSSTLTNCTVVGNSSMSFDAGGVGGSEPTLVVNSVLYYNTSYLRDANYDPYYVTLNASCTTPLPTKGRDNTTNEPSFVSTNLWGNLRLQSNSPCINAGNSAYVSSPTDLDGNPRIVGGTVDIGAYEFQSPASQLSYAWLQQYGLPTDGSADFTDPDGDRANNWQEWQCATIPTNALSALRLITPSTDSTNLVVTWQSVANKTYFLERSTGLDTNAPFVPVASNIVGQAGTTTFTDTNAASSGPRFYRVGVQ